MRVWFRVLVITMLVACGHKGGGGTDIDAPGTVGDGGGTGGDGGVGTDGSFPGTCTASSAQCSNCIDDDLDGRIDGLDLQCTGPLDNDEATFATGIPGDNKDAVNQDCFFDGDSGAGNDGCNIHVCCLLGITKKSDCMIGQNQFDPNECPPPIGTGTLSQKCIDTCGKAAPPGCDCFGCCTICLPGTTPAQCFDININPAVSPNCTNDTLSDPTKCLRCTKNTLCGSGTCNANDPTSCILCPGQDPSTLPSSCGGAKCPVGSTTCTSDSGCGSGSYCSNGCCIGVIL